MTSQVAGPESEQSQVKATGSLLYRLAGTKAHKIDGAKHTLTMSRSS